MINSKLHTFKNIFATKVNFRDELDEIHVTLLLYKLQHYFGAVVQTLRITSVNIRTNLMHAKYINTQYS